MKSLILTDLSKFIEEANSTNSSKDKLEVIRRYPQLKPIFRYTYDTIYYQYGVSRDNVIKNRELGILSDKSDAASIESVCECLNDRKYTGHNAIRLVLTFIDMNKEYEELVFRILDRNLKTRTDTSLINKIFPGTIPEFNVALADKYDEKMKIDFSKDSWYFSTKLDGIRVITIIDSDSHVTFWTRGGKQIETLDLVKKDIESLQLKDVVLDGEMCIVDENGNEDFQSILKLIRRKDFTIPNPRYQIFDCISKSGFEREYANDPFCIRLEYLKTIKDMANSKNCKTLSFLKQTLLASNEHLTSAIEEAAKLNWEGLILRKADSPYEGKRSKNMLKVKKFEDAEYEVKSLKFGMIRYIKNGKEIEEEMLSGVVISHKGYKVDVGSGFSQDERIYYHKHPEELQGKIITVKYFEETKDQNGDLSLRFPVVKVIHGDRREL